MPSDATVQAGVQRLLVKERERYAELHPASARAYAQAGEHLLGGVPMTWMNKLAGAFPLYMRDARGARVTDIDGHEYIDFALGDTGAMTGHSPPPVVEAITQRIAWCYHGSVDETFALPGVEGAVSREGNVGAPVPLSMTTRVAEFNDPDSLERELAYGDVAVVLMEPALKGLVARSGHGHDPQGDRRRHPRGCLRTERGAGRTGGQARGRGPDRHRWRRWHAGRQRAVGRCDARATARPPARRR